MDFMKKLSTYIVVAYLFIAFVALIYGLVVYSSYWLVLFLNVLISVMGLLLFYWVSLRITLMLVFELLYYYVYSLVVLQYAYYLPFAYEMKYGLFDLNFDVIMFHLTHNLSVFQLAFLFLFPLLILGVVYFMNLVRFTNLQNKSLSIFSKQNWFKIAGLLFVIYVFLSATAYGFNSLMDPFIISVIDSFDKRNTYEFSSYEVLPNKALFEGACNISCNSSYNKIFIFVMEGITSEEFEEFLPKSRFFNDVRAHTYYFYNYYTTNQDSRTALWAMFSCNVVPFESYLYNWHKYYGVIPYEKDILSELKNYGYRTIATYALKKYSLIFLNYDFDEHVRLYETNEKYVCVNSLNYAQGCEDLAIYDSFLSNVSHEKRFVAVQEFIFGHGREYYEKANKTPLEYYDDYLYRFYKDYLNSSLPKDVLIVIVGDHGIKGYDAKHIYDYKVPLMFISSNISGFVNDSRVYSHKDFVSILDRFMCNSSLPNPTGSFIVGQTMSNLLAYVGNDGYYVVELNGGNYDVYDSNLTKSKIDYYLSMFLTYQKQIEQKSEADEYVCKFCDEWVK